MTYYQKAKPVRDLAVRRAWREQRSFCFACGGVLALQVHHAIKPGRSDEPTNLLLLDLWCHGSAEGLRIVRWGEVQPMLTLAMQLWLKRAMDPQEYDPERLTVLYGQCLPELEEPPDYYLYWLRKRKVLLG